MLLLSKSAPNTMFINESKSSDKICPRTQASRIFAFAVGFAPPLENSKRNQGSDVRCYWEGQPNTNVLMLHKILLFK